MPNRDTDHGVERFCHNCQTWRAIELFAKHKRDGYQARCRECKRVDSNAAYQKNPEKFRERTRAVPAERKRAASKKSREKHRDIVNERTRNYFAGMPPEWHLRRYLLGKARTGCACNHVTNARRAGTMTAQPCEVCGNEKVQGHHDDYREPFSVRWLCQKHHVEWHMHNNPIYLPGWEVEFARLLAERGLSAEADALSDDNLLVGST